MPEPAELIVIKSQGPSKSFFVASVSVPTIATKEVSLTAAPIWRKAVCQAIPVTSRPGSSSRNCEGGERWQHQAEAGAAKELTGQICR
jgi:hypothetical protein